MLLHPEGPYRAEQAEPSLELPSSPLEDEFGPAFAFTLLRAEEFLL